MILLSNSATRLICSYTKFNSANRVLMSAFTSFLGGISRFYVTFGTDLLLSVGRMYSADERCAIAM